MSKNIQEVTEKQKLTMLSALEANFGNVKKAAKLINIAPSTHYRWLKEDWDYAEKAENIRDISFRNVKDSLLEEALKKVQKGDAAVLNKMMAIFFKNVPEEMARVSRYNNVPLRVGIKYIDKPEDIGR